MAEGRFFFFPGGFPLLSEAGNSGLLVSVGFDCSIVVLAVVHLQISHSEPNNRVSKNTGHAKSYRSRDKVNPGSRRDMSLVLWFDYCLIAIK